MAALAQAELDTVAPLDTLRGDLVVASYNLLAPCFVRPVDTRTGTVQEFAAFKWCDDAVLDWPRRRDALAQTLRQIAQHCDVVCLQEVEFEKEGDKRVPPAWLTDALQGFDIAACKTSILERNAKRNLRVVGKDCAVATAVAVGRGWRVVWTGENNGTTNVLVGDDLVKVIDLGQACEIGTRKSRIQGTPGYIAPEQAARRRITERTDVYNFGATMYWTLARRVIPTVLPPRRIEGPGTGPVDPARVPPPEPLDEVVPGVPKSLAELVEGCVRISRGDRPATMRPVIEGLLRIQRELS